MLSISIGIDVPDLAAGIRFYAEAFGFEKVSEPVPGVAVLRAATTELCLLEKRAGSKPSPHTQETRRYERHWTPVHLDLHVDELKPALARAIAAGARQEQLFDNPEHGAAAFCCDPFGHGFCLIQRRERQGGNPS
ncbi:MAG TPA: VOC family protein [Nevskia sp.]|jgi:catechol 2,3-dioxygenase-like lactoylglutathione lyase family enzyme|nr:VOC family protein [Nevskia sp.]